MKKLVFLVLIVFFSETLWAKKINLVEDFRFVSGPGAPSLILHYDGEVDFKIKEDKLSKRVAIVIDGMSFPAKLTRAIEGPSKNIVKKVSPFNNGSKPNASTIIVKLRQKVRIEAIKNQGEYRLYFMPLVAKKNYKKGLRGWVRKEQIIQDKIRRRMAAEDRGVKVARDLIKTLETPIEERVYKGNKVTLESSDVSVHDVFRLVGAVSGLNLVTSTGVAGTINLSLTDVPWDQLLDLVLREKQLKATSSGNVIQITTLDNYRKSQQAKALAEIADEEAEAIVLAIIPVNYAKADEIKKAISRLLVGAVASGTSTTSGGVSGTASTTSSRSSDLLQAFSRGKIEVDNRTNSLLVTHTKKQIERIKKLVQELDVPTPQILIESKVVRATENFNRSLGINWGGFHSRSTGGGSGFGINNFDTTDEDGAFSIVQTAGAEAGGGTFAFRLGSGDTSRLDLSLKLAETNDEAKVVSSPRILVNNKQQAVISDGSKVAITTSGADGVVTTELVDAALSLTVTPQATNSDYVLLDLQLTNDSPQEILGQAGITTQSIQTQVLVENAETLVLGGIYSFDVRKTVSGVPYLMNLPIIGSLFRFNKDTQNRRELLIFLTPRVIQSAPLDELQASAE